MLSDLTVIAIGAVSGLMAGGVGGWLVSKRRHGPVEPSPPIETLDTSTNEWIEAAADKWSVANGMPEAAPLVARKLRLGLNLQDRRRGRVQ